MKGFSVVILVSFALTSVSASAAEKVIECQAHGKSLSQTGGVLLSADASFSFVETQSPEGLRVLKNIEGSLRATPFDDPSFTPYIGHFKIDSLVENPKYRPRKYRDHSQFQNFDATDTTGSSEPGMWGNFVLEKDTNQEKKFQAHYIFQAGDHMGGTLHLSCHYR